MNSVFNDPAFWHRMQFAFTITYHYLFPQLTMGLAWFIVYWKWQALRTGEERYNVAVRFPVRIFGLNFAVGVVTGIPMEFQFGTNWAAFSKHSGGVIGQTLAMEGMFAFFLESAFVGALVWGEKRLGQRNHFLAAVGVAVGSWLSAYFILVTNSFMQHPVGYAVTPDGSLGYFRRLFKNGDTDYGTYEGTHKTTVKEDGSWETTWEGTWKVTGGTGKFKNIKGGGTYRGKATAEGASTEFEGEVEY